jgi:N-methylhydantoinase B/oxoprolinase/acetone carboxylase alpha subunit
LNGGKPGQPGRNTLLKGSRAIALKAKTRFDIHAGESLRIESPGGGGWGK